MRVRSWVLGLVVIVLVFGGIGITAVTGYWQTTSNKVPAKYTAGEFTGQYNPADIRGSYSFGEISELFQVPLTDLAAAFGLENDRDLADFLCKDLEGLYGSAGVGTNSVRLFVALYKGLPYSLFESDYLLEPAVSILKEKTPLTPEQVSFLDTHIAKPVITSQTLPANTSLSPTATASPTHTPATRTVTGKTTFQDLLDWGIRQEDIQSAIKDNLPSKGMAVRDYASQKGLDFSSLKVELQALIEASK